MENSASSSVECHELVRAVLNREVGLGALSALEFALDPSGANTSPQTTYESTIIAFDTNVFLKLSKHPKNDDVIDYLRTRFPGKLLLPGQVIQEFWKYQLNAVETLSASIKKHADNLKKEVDKVDSEYGEFSAKFQGLLEEFQQSYGYIYDDRTLRGIKLIVNLLSEKALVPYCNRNELSATALIRKRTKTPPGFKDDLDGDFFVWADLLFGVATLGKQGFSPLQVVIVTNDSKIDWSRNGIPHPILSAEMKALCGATLMIWTLDELARIAQA